MATLLPPVRGPKLSPFLGDIGTVQFVRLLSVKTALCSAGEVPHSRVFEVIIHGQKRSLKVFNFFSLEEIQPFVPMGEHLMKGKDIVVRHHMDPFFAECRAFGRLIDEGMDDRLAVRCYGYVFLPKEVETRIENQFGISDWNRKAEDEDRPLRAIVKDYIRFKAPFGKKKFPEMRGKVELLNKLGIYNMDIREANYLGGRLFDFSIAITSPHLSLWLKLRTEEQILEDMNYDLEAFDSMVQEMGKDRSSVPTGWLRRLRPRQSSSIAAAFTINKAVQHSRGRPPGGRVQRRGGRMASSQRHTRSHLEENQEEERPAMPQRKRQRTATTEEGPNRRVTRSSGSRTAAAPTTASIPSPGSPAAEDCIVAVSQK